MALFNNALPAGFEFDGYRVERVLGAGSFGITYLAEEANLGRKMAIKEYLPSDIAMRASDGISIQPIRSTEADTYEFGLEQFIEEARTLVRFQHPNIVPFHRLVEANGTCYVVMEYQEGRDLGDILKENGTLNEAELRDLVLPLLDGLDEVHRQGFLHRDIKPDNIFIREDGRPMLIDFGAAREALSRHSLKPTAILTPGFAPFEQYSSEAKQGPYTDIYAMGATLYRAAFGRTPPESTTRMLDDTLTPAAEAGAGQLGETLLAAIDAALAIQPSDRPQTIADWQAMIAGKTIVAAAPATQALDIAPGSQIPANDTPAPQGQGSLATALGITAAFLLVVVAAFFYLLPAEERLWPMGSRGMSSPTTPPPAAAKDQAKKEEEEKIRKAELLRPGRVFKDCDVCPEMVVIPQGKFLMRFKVGVDQEEAISMTMNHRYAVGRTEVTVAQFGSFVSDTGYSASGGCRYYDRRGSGSFPIGESLSWKNPGFRQDGAHPVVCVSWEDAENYLRWLRKKTKKKYRLPTDEEWDYAASANIELEKQYWGEKVSDACLHANVFGEETPRASFQWRYFKCKDGAPFTAPVAKFKANPFGLYDMLGNVWEWTSSCQHRGGTEGVGIDEVPCAYRVVRGGGWYVDMRSYFFLPRWHEKKSERAYTVGFRVVVDLEN